MAYFNAFIVLESPAYGVLSYEVLKEEEKGRVTGENGTHSSSIFQLIRVVMEVTL